MTTRERYEMRQAKKAERAEREKKFASMTIWGALKLMLERLGKSDCLESVKQRLLKNSMLYGYPTFQQIKKTEYQFEGIGRELGIMASIFIIDIDVRRKEVFNNELQRRFKASYDMFEIVEFEDCVIAFN